MNKGSLQHNETCGYWPHIYRRKNQHHLLLQKYFSTQIAALSWLKVTDIGEGKVKVKVLLITGNEGPEGE